MNLLFDSLGKSRLRQTRRQFLGRASTGIGSTALASLLNMLTGACSREDRAADRSPGLTSDGKWRGVANPRHIIPRAKRIIYLYMAGGPSHLESFDYKPELARMDGKPIPESFTGGQPIAQLQGQELRCMRPLYPPLESMVSQDRRFALSSHTRLGSPTTFVLSGRCRRNRLTTTRLTLL